MQGGKDGCWASSRHQHQPGLQYTVSRTRPNNAIPAGRSKKPRNKQKSAAPSPAARSHVEQRITNARPIRRPQVHHGLRLEAAPSNPIFICTHCSAGLEHCILPEMKAIMTPWLASWAILWEIPQALHQALIGTEHQDLVVASRG